MKDANGRTVMLGDRVKLWREKYGIVVCAIDEAQFSERFPSEEWAHLDVGALIETDDGELFHYAEDDEDFEVIAPTAENSN